MLRNAALRLLSAPAEYPLMWRFGIPHFVALGVQDCEFVMVFDCVAEMIALP